MKTRNIILIIFFLALLLRAYPPEIYTGWDESVYVQHAEYMVNGKDNYNEFYIRPPVLPILISGVFLIWHSNLAAQLLANLIAASIVFAAFLLGKRLRSEEAGLWAALLAAIHPVFVFSGHEIMTDAVVASFLAFSLYLALDNKLWLVALGGLLGGMAALTKFSGFGFITILGAYLLWKDFGEERSMIPWNSLTYTISSLTAIVPYFIWSKSTYGSYLHTLKTGAEYAQAASHPMGMFLIASIPILMGFIAFVIRFKEEKHLLPYLTLATAWLIIPSAYIATLHTEPRYFLPSMVAILPLTGIGIWKMSMWRYGKMAMAAMIALFSITTFQPLLGPYYADHPSQAVQMAEEVNKLNPDYPLYTGTEYPVFGLYTRNEIVVIDKPGFEENADKYMPEEGYYVVSMKAHEAPDVEWAEDHELLWLAENHLYALYYYHPFYLSNS